MGFHFGGGCSAWSEYQVSLGGGGLCRDFRGRRVLGQSVR